MPIEPLLIVGAGGHAKVVIDAVRCAYADSVVLQLADDNLALAGLMCMDLSIIAPVSRALGTEGDFHVAVGHNGFRSRLAERCLQSGMIYRTIVHPKAAVAVSAKIDTGCFIAANAVVAPMAVLNDGCIVNHGAVIDHDCVIGRYSHIAPNATLSGNVRLGEKVLIGAGANILPGIAIGDGCVIGAGAVVLHDLPAHATYAGVPAQRIQRGECHERGSD
jgi:sugar O-acyltransferase (sialic acid O-acetyltransferase NeuD family)